jgi:tetratricopeptide (TPR) repeat protein
MLNARYKFHTLVAICATFAGFLFQPTADKIGLASESRPDDAKKRLDGEIAAAKEAVRASPADVAAHCRLGDAYFARACERDLGSIVNLGIERGDYREAIAAYTMAISRNPKRDSPYAKRAIVYDRIGLIGKALVDCDEAIRLAPDKASPFKTRAWCHFERGESHLVIADCTEAIRLEPNDAENYYLRSKAYLYGKSGVNLSVTDRLDTALKDVNEALRLEPQNSLFYEARGVVRVWREMAAQRFEYGDALDDFHIAQRLERHDINSPPEIRTEFVSASALQYGKQQVQQMIHDRPEMRRFGDSANVFYELAARKFAGEDLHEKIRWNPYTPRVTATCTPPDNGRPGSISVCQKNSRGQDRLFEDLWSSAVFELFNINCYRDFSSFDRKAEEGHITREEFCANRAECESRAAEKLRLFYFEVVLPWATKNHAPTMPLLWHVGTRDYPRENLLARTNWITYGPIYDVLRLKGLLSHNEQKKAEAYFANMLNDCNTAEERCRVYMARADAYQDLGLYDSVIWDCNEALRADSGCSYAWSTRGHAYLYKHDYEAARADCSRAIQIVPQDANAYLTRGIANESVGRREEAISDYSHAIGVDPQLEAAYFRRGSLYYQTKFYDKAISDLSDAIKIVPDDSSAYSARARAYEAIGDKSHSKSDLETARKLKQRDGK